MSVQTYQSADRVVAIVAGIWLFISAFIWQHTMAQMTNTWIIGVLFVLFALLSYRWSEARYVNAAIAVWLFISVWALPTRLIGTQWNNAVVAIIVFVASLAPGLPRTGTPAALGRDDRRP
jgi:hypothetical protein